jgi:hypothetical protein
MADFVPSSYPQPWSWAEEEAEVLIRVCLCCDQPGHYQQQLEAHIADHGLPGGVVLSDDGTVMDGHHRIIAARRMGITLMPLDSQQEAVARWLRDHGPIDWVDRKVGDRLSLEQEWLKRLEAAHMDEAS